MWDKIRQIESSDGNVMKYVFEKSTAVAESVLYKYPTFSKRTVICCSTQSGCSVGCRMCGAGDFFVRSLTSAEIISQPVKLLEDTGVNPLEIEKLQIMFMSMGEPLLNWKNLKVALYDLSSLYPNASLLISTIGPKLNSKIWSDIVETSTEIKKIGLQFSIHESTDERRNKLIPFKEKLTLQQIADCGDIWSCETGRQAFFNYCAGPDNSSQEDADNLARLFDVCRWNATISVICEREENVAASNERQRELACSFREKLDKHGFNTRTFDPAGQDDVGGGCGQLWFVQDWMRLNSHLARPSVGFNLPVIHTPN